MNIGSRVLWLRLSGSFCNMEVEDISIVNPGKQRCLVCKSGGEMLACNDDDCTIFVHKSCMGCKPYVDGMGNFYCPYCFYKRYTSEEHISKKRAVVREKVLEVENTPVNTFDGIQSRCEETSKQTADGSPHKSAGVNDHTGKIFINQEVAQEDSSHRGTVTPFRKLGRVLWTEEEVEMLKEGVEKHSLTAHKKLPWKKILEFGHDVFDPSRTPSDLKDKWRNIKK